MDEKILLDWLYADLEELIDFEAPSIEKEWPKNDGEQHSETCNGSR